MTRVHRDEVLKLAPQQLHRTFTLSEAAQLGARGNARTIADLAECRAQIRAHESSDVPDPIGHDEAFFSTVGAQIADLLPPVIDFCRRI
jgi:protein-tyrosine phosphatase